MAVGDRHRNEPQSAPLLPSRAKVILQTLESDHLDDTGKTKVPERPRKTKIANCYTPSSPRKSIPSWTNSATSTSTICPPLAALQELNRLKERLK